MFGPGERDESESYWRRPANIDATNLVQHHIRYVILELEAIFTQN